MVKHKHTPGPWYIYEGNRHWIMAVDPDDDTPWHVAKVEPNAGPGEATPANARLITASPDLLTAAIELVAASDAYEGDPGDDERCRQAIDDLRAAIAKATGEATA